MARKQPARLASARAYYRLAAKAERAGQYRTAAHYRGVADRLVRQEQRQREAMAERKGTGLKPPGCTVDSTADQVAALLVDRLGADRAEAYARRTRVLAGGARP